MVLWYFEEEVDSFEVKKIYLSDLIVLWHI